MTVKQEHGSRADGPLFTGFDVGSSFVHYVVLNEAGAVVYSPDPIMHFANPLGAIGEAWRDIVSRFDPSSIQSTALTGSAAESFPRVMHGALYVYDSVAIPKGAEAIAPTAKYLFHIGAKDSYFFSFGSAAGRKIIVEWRTGTKCGGGSGMLVEKQCRRLFQGEVPAPQLEDPAAKATEPEKQQLVTRNRARLQGRVEEMFRRAEEEAARSNEPSEFLARCGVVVQSDLIHKQNEGATRVDNLAGLFRTVARNYVIDVLGSRDFASASNAGEAISTGGVFSQRSDSPEPLGAARRHRGPAGASPERRRHRSRPQGDRRQEHVRYGRRPASQRRRVQPRAPEIRPAAVGQSAQRP